MLEEERQMSLLILEDISYRIWALLYVLYWGFPGGSEVKASAWNSGDLGSIPGLARFLWRRKWQPTPEFLPGKFHRQRSLVGYKLDMTEHTCTPSLALYLFSQVIASAWRKPVYLTFSSSHFAQDSNSLCSFPESWSLNSRENKYISHF